MFPQVMGYRCYRGHGVNLAGKPRSREVSVTREFAASRRRRAETVVVGSIGGCWRWSGSYGTGVRVSERVYGASALGVRAVLRGAFRGRLGVGV